MICLFSTKAALRKAMVGLASKNTQFETVTELMRSIANYLTEGGLSAMDAKIKAQEEIVASLERQSKSLADEIESHEDRIEAQKRHQSRLGAEIEDDRSELSGLQSQIATAQEQLDSLVAQIGVVEREDTISTLEDLMDEKFDSLVSEEEFSGVIEKSMMTSFVSGLKKEKP